MKLFEKYKNLIDGFKKNDPNESNHTALVGSVTLGSLGSRYYPKQDQDKKIAVSQNTYCLYDAYLNNALHSIAVIEMHL